MSSVLVVDDEPDIRLLCRLVLEEAGHTVREAATAEVALPLLEAAPADYLLLDIRMEGMAGWEMLARVRSDARLTQMKVIVCSAHATAGEARRAERNGATFLAKPFMPADLRGAIAPTVAGIAAATERPGPASPGR